ncbi:Transmembrane protein [Candida parapsilosis]|nr:Transmembrane protein [Candida parapsilosis]KAI5907790.1 Transmembrane protein [Candida parapsilosis]
MGFLRGKDIPLSTEVLLGLLTTISAFLFVIKYRMFKDSQTSGSEELNFHDILVPFIQLIPSTTLFNPWVLISAIFAEISVISFIFSFVVLFVGSRFVERFWGRMEVIKFVLVVGGVTNLITVLVAIISNLIREDAKNMNTPLGGGLVNFRVKHLPFALLIILGLWSAIVSQSSYPAVPSTVSFFASFIYLRFFQALNTEPILPVANNDSSTGSVLIGDASDTFQLVEFFPAVTKPYVGPVFNQIYELSVLLGIVTPFNDETVQQSNTRAQKRSEQVGQSNKSIASSVAERRRQIALQVIEDRINKEHPK